MDVDFTSCEGWWDRVHLHSLRRLLCVLLHFLLVSSLSLLQRRSIVCLFSSRSSFYNSFLLASRGEAIVFWVGFTMGKCGWFPILLLRRRRCVFACCETVVLHFACICFLFNRLVCISPSVVFLETPSVSSILSLVLLTSVNPKDLGFCYCSVDAFGSVIRWGSVVCLFSLKKSSEDDIFRVEIWGY